MSHYLQVPTELLPYAGKLSATQLLIWADAWMFKKNTGKAYRTNAQLSEMLNVTERSVSRAVQELIRMGAITVQSNGRNRVIDPMPPSEWKVDANVHRRKRPSTQTSTDVDVHADPTQASMQTGHMRPCSTDVDVHLIDKEIDKGIDKKIDKKPKPKKEARPKSVEVVVAAFLEAGSTEEEANKYFDYYTANGWRVGRAAMKDWKAAARNWLRNEKKYGQQNNWRDRSSRQLDTAKALEWANGKR